MSTFWVPGERGHLVLDRDGAIDDHITGVRRGDGLDEHDVHLLLGDRVVQDAARNDMELAGAEHDLLLPFELDAQTAGHDEEHLILAVVRVPDQFAEELGDLHVLVVHATDHPGSPVLLHPLQFRRDVDAGEIRHCPILTACR